MARFSAIVASPKRSNIRDRAAPLPRWFKPERLCIYNQNIPRHSIESCVPYKNHVLALIDTKWIDMQSPNIEEGSQEEIGKRTQEPEELNLRKCTLEFKEENLGLREEN
ncbi:uncharacterized protein G2W53_021701 [Senna tora]|uniref:Uncharacterized protein n=1 Tax=Senna tora TaxID=362788 RepID=A0A834TJW4_9FABA|nr:uncharacterized protein G2W53_021701 [Senna tora]